MQRQVLMAPWRMIYLENSKMTGCFLCEAHKNPDPRQSLLVMKDTLTGVVLNRYPYITGHILVYPLRHVASFIELTRDELCQLAFWIQGSEKILREVYKPDGLNIGANIGSAAGAGLKDHMHVHVMPRWAGDTNFMATCGDTRIVPESLDRTYDKLFPLFAELPQP